MDALVCIKPGILEYEKRTEPLLSENRSIIKIKRIGICGTDLHAFEGTQPYFSYPRIMGHEVSGELVEVDGAPGFNRGDLVTFVPYFNCGNCIACRKGKPNCCTKMAVCGVHVDGGMAEYLSIPSNSLLHGNGLTLDELALVEPLAIGAHGVSRSGLEPGEFVLVIGAGPIGLATMDFARLAGGKVIALDINEKRLQFCKNILGVEHVINATTKDVEAQLMLITHGDMPTVVIDATGSQKAINTAFQYMAHGARYVLIGLQKGDISFSHPEFHKRESTLMSSRNATMEDFAYVISSIKNRKVNPSAYISHRVIFGDAAKMFGSFLNPENGVIKAVIEMAS